MNRPDGIHATESRRSPRTAQATSDEIANRSYADPSKSRVMKLIARLVAEGYAEWEMLDDGDVELRVNTGEIFILAKKAITRVA